MHPTVPATSRRTGLASSGPVCRLACSRGHIYTEENTRYMKGGGRGCRQCDHLYRQAYREARAGRSLSRPAPRLSDSEGFWSNVWLDDSGCWLWLGSLTDDGYGRCTWDNKRQRAHRVSWQVVKGPVPDGFVLDHLCRVRNCVNPAHLEPVTNRENVRRGLALGSKCRNGHDTADAIAYRDGRKACRTCARDRNRTYRSVASPDGRS